MEAYAHFRLDRQAIPCSKATMLTYEYTLGTFLRWVARHHPEVRRFEDLDVVMVRQYRAEMAERPGLHGKTLTPEGPGPPMPLQSEGVDAMMDRLQESVGFRIAT